jgi:sigma-54-specific transcriptional regulator
MNKLLTFPDSAGMALSIRAKALLFHDPLSARLLDQVERIGRTDATVLVIAAAAAHLSRSTVAPSANP